MLQNAVQPSPGRYMSGPVGGNPTETGNLILIAMQGQVIGRVQNITSRETWGTEPLYEIGSMLPAELVPLQWRGSLSVDKYKLRQSAMEALPINYGDDILTQQLFDIIIIDAASGNIIEKFRGCVQADMTSAKPANRPSTQNITFFYLEHLAGNALNGQ